MAELAKALVIGQATASPVESEAEVTIKAGTGQALVGETLATQMYHRIREDILQGTLPPDSKLQFEAMRKAYGAGLSPLREALSRLSSEGMVVLRDQKGFSVAPMSRKDLMDLSELRQMIEGKAVGLSLLRGDDAWEAQLIGAFHRLRKAATGAGGIQQLDVIEWELRHFEFHHLLASASGSVHMEVMRERLFNLVERYRRIVRVRVYTRHSLVQEHEEMLALALARDDKLVGLIQDHVRIAAEIILQNAVDLE